MSHQVKKYLTTLFYLPSCINIKQLQRDFNICNKQKHQSVLTGNAQLLSKSSFLCRALTCTNEVN